MGFSFLQSHRYEPLEKEGEDGEPIIPTGWRVLHYRDWRHITISLPNFIIVSLLFQLLILLPATFLTSHIVSSFNGDSFTLPLSKSTLLDSAGNYYPAAPLLKHTIETFHDDPLFQTMTAEPPTPETDEAWEAILRPADGVIQASYETGFDMKRMTKTVMSRKDPGLGIYGLEVYHQIHCLNRVRKSFWPEVYFPNETERQVRHHREHCINHLLNSVKCNGDISLDYWEHDEEDNKDYLKTDIPHICRDFSALEAWVTKHQPNIDMWRPSKGTS